MEHSRPSWVSACRRAASAPASSRSRLCTRPLALSRRPWRLSAWLLACCSLLVTPRSSDRRVRSAPWLSDSSPSSLPAWALPVASASASFHCSPRTCGKDAGSDGGWAGGWVEQGDSPPTPQFTAGRDPTSDSQATFGRWGQHPRTAAAARPRELVGCPELGLKYVREWGQ